MLIDFHTHAFPDKIAAKAMERLSYASGGLENQTDGTVDGIRDSMRRAGVDVSVVLGIATNAHQQKSVNDFAASINDRKSIFAFGSVYPDSEDALYELERIKALGLLGVKFHPEYQHFLVDEDKMRPIYKKISELGLVCVFHTGEDIGFPPPYGAMPDRMERALRYFDSPVVAAHLGGVGCSSAVLKHLAGKEGLYLDTAFSYGTVPKYYIEKIIECHGADKILFGTDTPWHSPWMEKKMLSSLSLTEEERDLITHKNALKLLFK